MGIKTVVNLRAFNSDRTDISANGLGYEHLYVKTWHPEEEDVIRFLQMATDRNSLPLFVHCQHGADRTGMMSAIYRMVVCGWTKDDAIAEMTQGGFGYHTIWKNLIRFIEDLDTDDIAAKAGIVR